MSSVALTPSPLSSIDDHASSSSSTELSLQNCYSVVYRLAGQDWQVLGSGWSQLHIYRDVSDGSHRLVGWAVSSFEVVINSNINGACKYKTKSEDFHKFTDEEGTVYGFGFYKKAESVLESKLFAAAIEAIIEKPLSMAPVTGENKEATATDNSHINNAHRRSKSFIPPAKPTPFSPGRGASPLAAAAQDAAATTQTEQTQTKRTSEINGPINAASAPRLSSASVSASVAASAAPLTVGVASLAISPEPSPRRPSHEVAPHAHESENKQLEEYYLHHIPLGKMKILPAKPTKASAAPVGATKKEKVKSVTDPTSVVHTQSVKYDPVTKSYQGLPPEWAMALNRQFGLDPSKLDGVKLPAYQSRIPSVLITMKDYLMTHEGHLAEGVFRIAPDASESTAVKQQFNENRFTGCSDIHVISNLIKVFFRELPVHLLNHIDQNKVTTCETEEQAGDIVTHSKEPYASYLLWLLDLCADIASHAGKNKMSAKNLGIVFGPNLFTPNEKDPLQTLLYSQKVAQFMQKAIDWRAANRKHQ